jgi:hypothetical protein
MRKLIPVVIILLALLLVFRQSGGPVRKPVWVDPYTTRNGKFVPGHTRKAYSTDPQAFKKRAYNRAYYQRNKWRYRSRRN